MNWLETLLSPALVRAMGWTIVHSLWQGTVVALALAGLLLVLRRHSSQVRYGVASVALLTMLGLALATFVRHYQVASAEAAAEASVPAEVLPAAANPTASYAFIKRPAAEVPVVEESQSPLRLEAWLPYFDHNLPLIVTAWLLGLLAMTLRLLGGLAYVQRLRHYRVRPLPAEWNQRLAQLSARVGLRRPVRLLESALVKAPLVAGHLKPVILLPLGTLSWLSQAHLEAILAHELAHIMRRDYLMNLLQSVAEILFFYHPAAWFITACLRTERENCCDDVATTLCGDPMVLAQALTTLAELGLDVTPVPQLAMAAVGPDGSLLGRIRRLVQRRAAPTFSEGFMAALVVVVGMALLGLSSVVSLAAPLSWVHKTRVALHIPFWRDDTQTQPAAPAAPVSPHPAEAREALESQEARDDDGDRKKKRRAKDTSSTVIIRDENRRRRESDPAVVIKRDKKGRVTELYVDGRRIELDDADDKKTKGTKTEIITLAPEKSRRTRTSVSNSSSSVSYGMSDQDREALERGLQRIQSNADRITIDSRSAGKTYVYRDGSRVEVRSSSADAGAASYRSQEKALVEALNALRAVERSESRPEIRTKIHRELEALDRQRETLRRLDEHSRERTRLEREQAQAEREKVRAEREAARAEREKARAERAKKMHQTEEKVIDELVKEMLIKDKENFRLVMTSTELTIDGEKQPAAVHEKYRKMYEEGSERQIGASSSVIFSNSGSAKNRIYSDRASSPSASYGPGNHYVRVPTPPMSPRPAKTKSVKVNSVSLGDELRKDGLIGRDDKSYSVQLNSTGFTVNGKRQSDELARKYRTLMGKGDEKSFTMDIVVNED
ncbi:M56 family metallopeptidase [Hymenobacter sp. BT175]|uniref:M56 family metallopeptidase n=1 Tax=Hymenobacter translucens TaxID=2886507 RepID=UPI001D0E3C11|nr:M56 family metallopeptidase [Hymenobacter translucens]MCC2546958.1 M56 family metallopeptidase [Hymenobacter translucens]